jgi:hypothetical protein
MIHNDIKLQIEFNNFENVFRESPTNYINVIEPFCLFKKGELIKQNVNGILAIGEFVYYDIINQYLYYNKLIGNFLVPTTSNDPKYVITGGTTLFTTNIVASSLVIIDQPYFRFNIPSILESYLLVNYIYLDNEERFAFLNKSHEYLIPIVTNISKATHSYSNSSFKIPFTNPNKIIFWIAQLNSNININDIFNYTLYPISDNNIIEQNTILINSIPRIESTDVEFYTNLQIYLNNFVSSSPGINMFSFSLNPNDYQPSGSLNFSKIDDAYIQIKVNKNINYNNSIVTSCYGLQNNIFRVSNGLGGLGYFL